MKKIKLSKDEFLHLAKLADLKLDSQEEKKISNQLTETLDYIQNLNEINTQDVGATNQTIDQKNEFFKDGSKNTRKLTEKEVFQNTKVKKGSYFSVKKIL